MSLEIKSYSRIRDFKAFRENELICKSEPGSFAVFAERCYRSLKVDYPKFHKMDNLCKLGFLASDILLINNNLNAKYDPYDTGVVLANANGSLDTDIRHHRQIQTGPASPAVFVYSLPNIVIGEICIRNGIKGENTFFINDHYDIPSQVDYISLLFDTGAVKACIGGWVEFTETNHDCFLFLIEHTKNDTYRHFDAENIIKLYES